MAARPLRIGFVPEHFSTPLYFARKHYGLDAELISFPSGTGHMIAALRAGELDVAIGLTEGWIAGLGKEDLVGDGGYRLVGTYVETPLRWAISTGAHRPEGTSLASLKGSKMGVSRIGSGSYVMGFVLADQQGWLPDASDAASLSSSSSSPYADIVTLNDFTNLRRAVNNPGEADFFLWEHFTSKKYHDAGEIRRVGDIDTPWSSWKIVASTQLASHDARVRALFAKLDKGVAHFEEHRDEAIQHITTELGYTEADTRAWLGTVRFASRTEGVRQDVVRDCVAALVKAGVLVEGKGMRPEAMVVSLSS